VNGFAEVGFQSVTIRSHNEQGTTEFHRSPHD
jgi:hypothetical protein